MRQLKAAVWVQRLSLFFLAGCFANNVYSNGRNFIDLIRLERDHPNENLIHYLKDHGIRAALGDYWISHNLTFLSDESLVVTPG